MQSTMELTDAEQVELEGVAQAKNSNLGSLTKILHRFNESRLQKE